MILSKVNLKRDVEHGYEEDTGVTYSRRIKEGVSFTLKGAKN